MPENLCMPSAMCLRPNNSPMAANFSVQNQTGNKPKEWSKTGVVIEVGPHHSYTISVVGSKIVTRRNCQFLRKISPFSTEPKPPTFLSKPSIPEPPAPNSPQSQAPPIQPLSEPDNESLEEAFMTDPAQRK